MSLPLVHLLEDPNDNESKLWKMLRSQQQALEGTGAPLAGWGDSSGSTGQGDAITGAGSGPVGISSPIDSLVPPQEITELAAVPITGAAGGGMGWSWVGPNKELYVASEDGAGNPSEVFRVVESTITQIPPVDPLNLGYLIFPGYSDEPSYLKGFSGGVPLYLSIRKGKQVALVGHNFTQRVWTKLGNRIYSVNADADFTLCREYDADSGVMLRELPIFTGLGSAISLQATPNFLWMFNSVGTLYKFDRTSLTLLETTILDANAVCCEVINETVVYFFSRNNATSASLKYLHDGVIHNVDTDIATSFDTADIKNNPFVRFSSGVFYMSNRARSTLYRFGTLTMPGESAASEILLLGENGQITPDNERIATLDTINRRVGINTGAPSATVDIWSSDKQDVPILSLHSPNTDILIDLFSGSSVIENLRIVGKTTVSPATGFDFYTTDSSSILRKRVFIGDTIGFFTGNDLLRWQVNATGELVGQVTGGGTIVGGTASGDVLALQGSNHVNGGLITLNNDVITGIAASGRAVSVSPTISTGNSGVIGLGVFPNFTGAGDSPQGLSARPTFTPTVSIGATYGFLGLNTQAPPVGVTVSEAIGMLTQHVYNDVAGAVTLGTGLYVATPSVLGALVPSNQTGIYINNQGAGGITRSIGLHVVAQSGSTTNIDILSPSITGGIAAGSTLTLRATAGVGVGSEAIILQVGSNGALEALRVGQANSQSVVAIGTTVLDITNASTLDARLIVAGAGVAHNVQIIRHTTVGGGGGILTISATRGAGANTHSALQAGDGIGTLSFTGSDGVRYIAGATITTNVATTFTTDSAICNMVFAVNDGSSATTPPVNMTLSPASILTFAKTTARIDLSAGTGRVFKFVADATDPTGGGGAAAGRIPIDIAGTLRYIPYY